MCECEVVVKAEAEAAGAPEAETEVTPEMMKEGARLLGDWYGENDDWFTRDRVRELYEMLASISASC
jgi:hypothetical protein